MPWIAATTDCRLINTWYYIITFNWLYHFNLSSHAKSIILLANLHCIASWEINWGVFHLYLLLELDLTECQMSSPPSKVLWNWGTLYPSRPDPKLSYYLYSHGVLCYLKQAARTSNLASLSISAQAVLKNHQSGPNPWGTEPFCCCWPGWLLKPLSPLLSRLALTRFSLLGSAAAIAFKDNSFK